MTSLQRQNHLTFILIFIVAMIVFTATVLFFGIIKPHYLNASSSIKIDGVYLAEPKEIEEFQLMDDRGKAFTKNNLKNRWTLMFFGFTNCGYVCPTTMAELNKMVKTLQKKLPNKKLPQVVLVSVDPERDSVKKMHDYVKVFNPKFIGVRADLKNTQEFEKQLHIAAVKMQPQGAPKNQYMVNHSADIILFNPEGKVQAYLSYPHESEQMVKDYQLILSAKDDSND
jgi:protein SCO1/2